VLHAQSITATLSGTATDPAGAAIPGVAITAASNETGLKKEVKTDSEGRYTIPFLAPGVYAVTAQAAGFTVQQRTGVRLEVAQSDDAQLPARHQFG
jgi:Cna protein B-type domain.